MNRIITSRAGRLLALAALWSELTGSAPAALESPNKPHIIVIVADDMGYGDARCYNPEGKIPTPHIDKLAAQGMRFTDAHSSASMCTPSRYSLLTGRYPWRTRLQSGVFNTWAKPLIAPERLTLAGLAKQQGYHTACIGKWHLGFDWAITPEMERFLDAKAGDTVTDAHRESWKKLFSQPIGGGPLGAGFESFFGVDMPHKPPYGFIENNRTSGVPSEFLPREMIGGYLGDGQGPAMRDWKLEDILPTLRDRAADFIAQNAKAERPFFLYLPLTTPHTPFVIQETEKGRGGIPDIFADLMVQTDSFVGRVSEQLEKSGVADNTLVILTSDNGQPWSMYRLANYGHKSGGPLRGCKSTAWEGGHRMPFIARWPKVVPAGSVCNQHIQQMDLLATFAEMFGLKLPENAGEDSVSFFSLLQGGQTPVRDFSVSACGARGTPTIRQGDWKLILNPPTPTKSFPGGPELYNLAEDLGETKNLANQHPERVGGMTALLEKIIADGRSTPGPKLKNDAEVRCSYRKDAPQAANGKPAE